jgi:hypothetical protein
VREKLGRGQGRAKAFCYLRRYLKLLNNSFNKGAPADLPKVVLVCVSNAYYGMELLNVQPIEGKFTIEDHRTKITFQ